VSATGSTRTPERAEIDTPVGPVEIEVRRSDRAKRLQLRSVPPRGVIELVIPRRASFAAALAFAKERADWIAETRAGLTPPRLIEPGARLPLLGIEHRLEHRAGMRGTVWQEADAICVAGDVRHFPRRLRDWLIARARTEIAPRVVDKTTRIGRSGTRLSLKDTRTRWGSCSPGGTLSFNWRIVMAPPVALDYLVAHEVAHLREPHHRASFWRLAEDLAEDLPRGRDWLQAHGGELLSYAWPERA
jgi:predicted metal-dependent hydrolase